MDQTRARSELFAQLFNAFLILPVRKTEGNKLRVSKLAAVARFVDRLERPRAKIGVERIGAEFCPLL